MRNVLLLVGGLVAALAPSAAGAIVFRAGQDNYNALINTVVPIEIYLEEQLDGGTSIIVEDEGMFSMGVRVTGMLTSSIQLLDSVDPAPAFTFDIVKEDGDDSVENFVRITAEVDDPFPPGPMPDSNGLIHLATFYIEVGSIVGTIATFEIIRYDDSPAFATLITHGFTELDDDILPGSFTVTAIPEPAAAMMLASLGIMFLGGRFGRARRRRRSPF